MLRLFIESPALEFNPFGLKTNDTTRYYFVGEKMSFSFVGDSGEILIFVMWKEKYLMQNAKVKEDLRVIEGGFDPQGAIDQVPRLRKKFKEVF